VRLSGERIGSIKIQYLKDGQIYPFFALEKSCAQHELCEKAAFVLHSSEE
jgi:hypothetical protein